jgi:hypothetical protein
VAGGGTNQWRRVGKFSLQCCKESLASLGQEGVNDFHQRFQARFKFASADLQYELPHALFCFT